MNTIIFKTLFKKGSKGLTGGDGFSLEVPTNAIIGYDGNTAPTGYEITTNPGEGSVISKTITQNGTYNAGSDNVDGYNPVIVNVTTEPVVNPVYRWWANDDRTLIVREKISDGSFRWYWNNYDFTTKYMSVPSNLTRFIKNGISVKSTIFTLSSYYNYDWLAIGFYQNTIRCWNAPSGQANLTPTQVKCIMESTDTAQSPLYNDLYHEWEAPTFDPYNG